MGGTQENLVTQAVDKWKSIQRELDRLPHQQAGTEEGRRAIKLKDELRSQANTVHSTYGSYRSHMNAGGQNPKDLRDFGFRD